MKKKSKIIGSLILFLFLIILGNTIKVDAASVSITGNKTVTQGDKVTISANVTAGAWNLVLAGNGQTKSLVGQTSVVGNASASTSITFTASNVGNYTFTLKGDITDFDTDRTEKVNKTCTITVKEKTSTGGNTGGNTGGSTGGSTGGDSNTGNTGTTSSTAQLKMITTKPVDFKGFKATSTGPYKVTVENDVTSIEVTTSKKENGQKVSISGNKNLDVGTNKVSVTVTSADGKNKMTYVIYVTRKSADGTEKEEEDVPNKIDENEDEEQEELGITAIILEEGLSLSPEFKTDIYEYTVELYEDLKEIEINAIPTQKDAKIEILGNKDLKMGENIITIKVTSADGKETVEYKVKVIKAKSKPVVQNTVTKTTPLDFSTYNEIDNYSKVIIVLIAIIALIGIIATILDYTNNRLALEEGEFGGYGNYDDYITETKDNFNYGSTFEEEIPAKRRRSKGKHS